jgi:CheY-like chemotaxis protein
MEKSSLKAQGTLLVVEDEDEVRGLMRLLLERQGFDVLEARDGQEGVEMFQVYASRLRGMVLDLTMPRLSGLEVLDVVRRLSPELPVLLASGFVAEELESRPCTRFLAKPFQPSELITAIEQLLQ